MLERFWGRLALSWDWGWVWWCSLALLLAEIGLLQLEAKAPEKTSVPGLLLGHRFILFIEVLRLLLETLKTLTQTWRRRLLSLALARAHVQVLL